ncbi:MAG: glycosyltransferase family 4 protein [archaeon]
MNVVFISRRFYPEVVGGGQLSGFYIAKSVKNQGNKVDVITFSDKNKEIVIDGIKIHVLKISTLNSFPKLSNMDYMYIQMARLSSKHIRKIDPDIIHLLNWESIPLSAVYYKLRFRKRIVATANGPIFGCFTQNSIDYNGRTCINCQVLKRLRCATSNWGSVKGLFYYLYSLYFMNMLKFSYKYVDSFAAVSSAMVPLLENIGIPRKKIEIIHNPVEIKKKEQTDLKKRLGIKGKVIIYVGRLAKAKGVQHTINAMRDVNATFLVIGEKRDYYDKLNQLVKELKLEKKVIFVGFVENNRLVDYYSIADAAVHVPDFFEPYSRFLIEACSFGIPIVASNIGGNKDIIDGNGILVQKIETLSVSINGVLSKANVYKNNSLKLARELSLDSIGKKYNDLYLKNLS